MHERFAVDDLPSAAGVQTSCDRVVIGIGAPLGWPAEFLRLVGSSSQQAAPCLPGPGGEIENRLAYRFTDRVVHARCGEKPLSAAFGKLGNNATKAITVCQLLRRDSGAAVVPQEEDDRQPVVFCEAYPGLRKTGGRKGAGLLPEAEQALAGLAMLSPGTDEADAVLCALTAACCDNHVRGLGRGLPELGLPPDDPMVRQEGWVYFHRPGPQTWFGGG
jgi:hypothetical protein